MTSPASPLTALALLPAIVLATPAAAQWKPAVEARITPAYKDCMAGDDAARGVTPAMTACTHAEVERQDARLNQAYVMVMKRLPATRRPALRTSQRQWIKRRDANCQKAAAAMEGGTGASLEFLGCMMRETIERTLWLEKYR